VDVKELLKMNDINISDYDYDLPDDRIAQYPVKERDGSRLLLFDGHNISSDIFKNIDKYIPDNSLLVFNNTRVIKARLLFQKKSGARIEIFCLEPISPADYELSFSSKSTVEWNCIIGNLKKWKTGILSVMFRYENKKYVLRAEKISSMAESWRIRFEWNNSNLTFGEIIESMGHTPLPPYINREDEKEDTDRYQTVYSSVRGSVAAPTAGLHFTADLIKRLHQKGIRQTEITLHVGAGTFQPVKAESISEHNMHCEHFFVTNDTIRELIRNHGKIIAVGTTSVRTIESLYWIGVKVLDNPGCNIDDLQVAQWEPYEKDPDIPVKSSLTALSDLMVRRNYRAISASTRIIIIPGYKFRMIAGMITNFHQPKSTLLLLVSAWTGAAWHRIYEFALENRFRFLSYGDSSLLIR
jgi:S-adenosylmethionine:tRNA ribosyltransferase-isomerase